MNDKGGFSEWLSYRMKVLRVSDRHFFRFVWSVAIIIVAVTVIISAMVTSANEKKAKKKTKKEEPKTEVVATVTDATETDSKKARETEWNLILVNKDNPLPKGYSVPEFEELNNNQKVDSRIYPELQKLFDDARAQGYSPTITKSYAVPEGSGDLQALLDQGMTKEQAEEALAVYRSRFSTVGWSENEVLEGVPEMLSSLQSQGKKLYVASSKPEIYVLRILEHFGLKDFFSIITGGDMEGKRTEKADVIREVMRRGGFEHEELKSMLMVGDRKHDIIGAKLCGIDSAGVYTGFAGENELEEAGADYVCFGIGELSKLLISF